MRRSDWEQRLSDSIAAAMSRPYAPGEHDCLLFPAAIVKALTGKDHGRGHRRKYSTEAGGHRYLRRLGFDSVEAMLDSLFAEKPAGFAQRGDLVLASDGIPAVCLGSFALSVGRDGNREGLVTIPRSDWIKAWGVE